MSSKLIPSLLLLSLTAAPVLAGSIYKTVDANGNTLYTDSPSVNQKAEEVNLPAITPLQINTPQRSYKPATKKQNKAKIDYSSLKITSPANDSTVRNNGSFNVSAELKTGLMSNHKFQLFVNGKKHGKKQRHSSFKVTDLDRGAHVLEVAIVDRKGKKIETASSTVHVQKAIYRAPVKTPSH